MFRFVVVMAVALLLAVSGALGLRPDPQVDASTSTVAVPGAEVGSTRDLDGYVTSLQDRLSRLPRDDSAWANLGLAYVEQARVTGNPTLYGRADQAIDRSVSIRPGDNAAALAASAALQAARHHFGAALDSATRALALAPYDVGALAVRVDALTELGRYDAQIRALRTADRRQPGVPVATRYAYAFELRGDLARASGILRRAVVTAGGSDRAQLLTLVSDLDRRQGRLHSAAVHVSEAQRLAPTYVPARASAARLAVARGDLNGAVRRWEQVVDALPLPEYLIELGELYEFLGRRDEAQAQYDVVSATHNLFGRSGVNTDLETAVFDADHGDPITAAAGARAEWARRKSIHVADALAWALHRSGNDREALALSREATRLGTAESKLWLHRGAIEARLGLFNEARRHLRRGLDTDPGTSPWQRARALSLLEDLENTR